MAEVPTSLLDELTDEVNKLSGDAQEKTRAALKTLIADWEKHGGGDVAALRNAAYETIEAVLLYYADTCAAARAAEYYDAVRQAQGFSGGYSAVAESMRDPDAALGAVKYFVGKVVEGAPEAFVSLCVTRIDEEMRRAGEQVRGAQRPQRPGEAAIRTRAPRRDVRVLPHAGLVRVQCEDRGGGKPLARALRLPNRPRIRRQDEGEGLRPGRDVREVQRMPGGAGR